MQDLHIKGESGDFFIPTIHFSVKTGICELSGDSFLENTFEFYEKIQNWIKQYIEEVKRPLFFEIRLTYFNTASSKSLLELFIQLKSFQEQGGDVKVTWYYREEDDQLLYDIEDFTDVSGLEIEKICIDDL